MKRTIGILLVVLMMVSVLTACGQPAPAEPEEPATENGNGEPTEENVHFAILFGTGGLGDNGYNDEVNKGCEMAVEQLGATYDYAEPRDISEFETQLRMFADTGEYDTIIAISSEQADALKMVAEDYPEQRFTMLDTIIEGYDNIKCITASHPEQHFLSGMLAGIATQDDRFELSNPENIVGFTIAMDTPTSRGQASGFLAGAKYVNPDIEIFTNFIGSYTDPVTAKELALVMYERGADIVSVNAGSSSQGVFAAAQEVNRYVIGTSLEMVEPEVSLSTSVKKVWNFIVQEIDSLDKGTWEPGFVVLGIAQGVCDYDVEGLDVVIPDDVIAILDEAKQSIADGNLVLPTDLDQVDEWAANNKLNK